MKTLNDCKNEVAKSLGMPWEKILLDRTLMDTVVEGVARRYAEQQAVEFASWVQDIPIHKLLNSNDYENLTDKQLYQKFKEEQK